MSVDINLEFSKEWMEEYVHMLADPSSTQTTKDFAEEHGISEQALYKWKSRHKDEVAKRVETLRKQYRSDVRSKAWRALSSQLGKGDTPAIKLAFQLLGDLVERSENRTEILTPEDKKARIAALLEKVQKDKEAQEG